jgi:hypothetical protein
MKRIKEIKSKFGIFAVIKIQKYVWNGRWGVSLIMFIVLMLLVLIKCLSAGSG